MCGGESTWRFVCVCQKPEVKPGPVNAETRTIRLDSLRYQAQDLLIQQGVTLITLALIPAVTRLADASWQLDLFEAIEARFSSQAKFSVTLAGATGFYMTHRISAWDRFLDPGFWWMHAMVLIWVIFTVLLFVAEPMFLHTWFRERARRDPARTLSLIQRGHIVLLTFSLVTVGAAVLGAHGMLY